MDDTIRAIWYISLEPKTDWLLGLQKKKDHWEINYRFRYYNSDDPFDKDDTKNWYGGTFSKNMAETEVIEKLRMMFSVLQTKSGEKGYELIRGTGSFDDFLDEFKTLPFVHMSDPMNKEEFEEYEKTGDMPAQTNT